MAVLAQDLIWSERLVRSVEGAGAIARRAASDAQLDALLPDVGYLIVDLTARAYDPLAAIGRARAAGVGVLAVGQHTDADQRKRALASGADRVLAYRKLFEDGPATVSAWIRRAGSEPAAASLAVPPASPAVPPAVPAIPAGSYRARLSRAVAQAEAAGFAALLIGVGPDLRYLTGYEAMPLERLTMLVVVPGQEPVIVVPRLEARAASAGLRTSLPILTWDDTEDPYELVVDRIKSVCRAESVVAVSDTLWASHVLRLQRGLDPATRLEVASSVLRILRMVKDDDEVALLTLAAHAADRVVARIAAGPLVGRTEADVAREVRELLVAEGHEAAEFAIVGSGPNSASPHHDASDRVIGPGEPVVLDIGGTLGGYGSDITRTLWVTGGDSTKGPDERFRHLFGVLQSAQSTATRAVRPGIACEAVDAVARAPIDAEGYGEAFFHRTGHGIGLEGHEDPYLVSGNDLALQAGMAFSVEPGIYLDGIYGARIEDIVVCGPDGPIVLNEAPRELNVVDG